MMPNLVFAAMAAVTVAVLLVPLLRRGPAVTVRRADYDVAVYRDQLGEIDRDLARGLLSDEQAHAARVETHRRILWAAEQEAREDAPSPLLSRGVPLAVALLVPAAAIALYTQLGSPHLPDRPYAAVQAERLKLGSDQTQRILGLVERLVKKLEANPEDVPGWQMLGRSYVALGRTRDAAVAYRRAVAAGASDVETLSSLGELITQESGGAVTAEARNLMVQVLRQDPRDPRARYYLGVERRQVGEAVQAIAIWRELEATSTPDAPWLPAVRQQISETAAKANLDPATVAPSHPLFGSAPTAR